MEVIAEGKTKVIYRGVIPNTVEVYFKNTLSAGDGTRIEEHPDIGISKARQCISVFQLLQSKGLPLAFISEGHSSNVMICEELNADPLELVMREIALGSILKRRTDLKKGDVFPEILCELFHKDALVASPITKKPKLMSEGEARKEFMKNGKWMEGVYTDPFIDTSKSGVWLLHPPKSPFNSENPILEIEPLLTIAELIQLKQDIMIPCFTILRDALKKISVPEEIDFLTLADMKIETGISKVDGRRKLGDDITADAWRVCINGDLDNKLDKDRYRQGENIEETVRAYRKLADLMELLNKDFS